MGFRVPLTSASSLDTRDGTTNPGVIIEGARATFTDGAFHSATVEMETVGGVSGGSRFVLDGGPLAGRLELNQDELPGGGYESVARILADRVELPEQNPDESVTATLGSIYAHASAPYGQLGVDRYGRRVQLRGAIINAVSPFSAAGGASFTLGSVPARLAPARTQIYLCSLYTGTAWSYVQVVVRGASEGAAAGRIDYIAGGALSAGLLMSFNDAEWQIP